MYPTTVTADLQKTIEDWFDDREIVDNDMFDIYFRRVLNRDYKRYKELLRIEPGVAKYDWLVNRYNEWRTWGTDNTDNDGTRTKDYGMGIEKSHGTQTSIDNTENGGTYHEHTQYGGADQTEAVNKSSDLTSTSTPKASSTTTAETMAVDKANPYSESYEGATAGSIPALDWSTSSSQAQTKQVSTTTFDGGSDTTTQHNEESGGDKTTYGRTTDTYAEGSRTSGSITKTSGSDKDQYSGTDKTQENEKTKYDTDRYHMETGRTGEVATLLEQAKTYIETTAAWSWLANRLEVCFMGVYEW